MEDKRPHRTPEEIARLKSIREHYQQTKPTIEEVRARSDYSETLAQDDFLALRELILNLKKVREDAGLSLSEISERSGIDKAALSRLETGRQVNPTYTTLVRYAKAIGKSVRFDLVPYVPTTNLNEQPI